MYCKNLRAYSKEVIAEVLAANDIVDIIGAAIDLKSAGSGRFKGLCPFHQEKTPSFSVSRDRQFYYCFGCGKGGDALKFLQDFEGLPFGDALRRLADRGGVRLPALSERDDKDEYVRQQLLELGKQAAQYFRKTMEDPLKGGAARQYLKSRALQPETIKRFGLGYAPNDWDALVQALRKARFSDAVLDASGLIRSSDRGRRYAFFRDRLVIPIRDTSGNIVAFGGRDLSNEPNVAKYINTPENPVYKKSRVLYGLYEARDAMRAEKRAILVEGYFDLMRCFDSGIECVVAPCGTALTQEQAKLIKRYVNEVVVVFDGDAAGVRAALRGIGLLTDAGLTVRALLLPKGQDPDDFIRAEGPERFRQEIDAAQGFIRFYVAMSQDRLGTIEGRTEVARELFAILRGVNDALRRQEYLKETAEALRLDPWAVRREFEKMSVDSANREAAIQSRTPETPKPPKVNHDDCAFVSALLQEAALMDQAKQAVAELTVKPRPLEEVLIALFNTGPDVTGEQLESEDAKALYAAAVNYEPLAPAKAEELVEKRLKRLQGDTVAQELKTLHGDYHKQRDGKSAAELLNKIIEAKQRQEQIGPF